MTTPRTGFHQRLSRLGADGAVVSDIRLNIWEIEPSDGHVDHVAEATIVGTAIARFGRSGAPLTSRSHCKSASKSRCGTTTSAPGAIAETGAFSPRPPVADLCHPKPSCGPSRYLLQQGHFRIRRRVCGLKP
jgi:hypothetical protein